MFLLLRGPDKRGGILGILRDKSPMFEGFAKGATRPRWSPPQAIKIGARAHPAGGPQSNRPWRKFEMGRVFLAGRP